MGKILQLFLTILACYGASMLKSALGLNDRPIIGILSQEPSPSMIEGDEDKNYTSYIAASYVKFMESAGARVVPILINQERNYYKRIAGNVNGLLFPGGANSISNTSGYGLAGQYLYEEVLERNAKGIYLPLWATCLGFEMLFYLSTDYTNFLVSCEATNIALPLNPERGVENSLLFSQMPQEIYNIFITENVTANFHHWCYTKEDFQKMELVKTYRVLTTNFDINGLEFISTTEHKTLPIFGTQWHPEKNSYEWKNTDNLNSIPHSRNAVISVQYFAEFFVNQARQNTQSYPTEQHEEGELIYGHQPKYIGNASSSFEQIYLFR